MLKCYASDIIELMALDNLNESVKIVVSCEKNKADKDVNLKKQICGIFLCVCLCFLFKFQIS